MKKKWVIVLLTIATTGIASVNTMKKKEVIFGQNSICFVKGQKISCTPTTLCNEFERKEEGILVSDGKTMVRIDDEGKLTIYGNAVGYDEKQGSVIVRDPSGRVTFDTAEHDLLSLDEENCYGQIELQPGSKVTLGSCTVIYDQLEELISKDGEIYFVLKSIWKASKLVSVATHDYGGERSGNEEVLLKITGKEIKLLNDFLEFDQKSRKKLLRKVSIRDFTGLLVNLHLHDFIKEFKRDDFDCANQLLVNRIHDLLKQATNQDVSCWPTEIEWLEVINTWLPEERRVIENVLRRVIRPVPNVLFKQDNIKKINSYDSDTRVQVYDKNGGGKIIDLEVKNEVKKVLFQGDNIERMRFDSTDTKIIVIYNNGRGEVRDLENGRVIFGEDNIKDIYFDPTDTKIIVGYNNNRGEVRDFEVEDENGRVIFGGNNINRMYFDSTGTRVMVFYNNDRGEVRDLGNGGVIFGENNIKYISFDSTDTKIMAYYNNGRGEVRDLENGRVIFGEDNIKYISFDSTDTKIMAYYNNGRGEVKDLENGRVIFGEDNIKDMYFDSTDTKIIVVYNNDRGEVRDLGNGGVIFEEDNIKYMYFDSTGTKIMACYNNGRGEVRDLENGRVIFGEDNIKDMYFDSTDTKIIVVYNNDRGEVRDFEVEDENGRVIFGEDNIKYICVDSTGTNIMVCYNNGRGEVRDLENGRVIFGEDNIKYIQFDPTGTNIIVDYNNDRGEVRDLEDCDRDIIFIELKPEELILIHLLTNLNPSYTGSLAICRSLWKSLDSDLKRKLHKSYLLEETKVFFNEKKEEPTNKIKTIVKLATELILFFIILYKFIYKRVQWVHYFQWIGYNLLQIKRNFFNFHKNPV